MALIGEWDGPVFSDVIRSWTFSDGQQTVQCYSSGTQSLGEGHDPEFLVMAVGQPTPLSGDAKDAYEQGCVKMACLGCDEPMTDAVAAWMRDSEYWTVSPPIPE